MGTFSLEKISAFGFFSPQGFILAGIFAQFVIALSARNYTFDVFKIYTIVTELFKLAT